MIPFIIAGAIGYGIAKLFEKDDTKKFVKGGGVENDFYKKFGNNNFLLVNFDLSELDDFEEMQFNHISKSSSKADSLQVLINNVEGDYSQLSPILSKIAEAQYPSDEFYEDNRQYADGGSIRSKKRGEKITILGNTYEFLRIEMDNSKGYEEERVVLYDLSDNSMKSMPLDMVDAYSKYAGGGEINLDYAKKEWGSYTKDAKINRLIEAGYSKKVAENLSSEAWESLEKQVQNDFKNNLISSELESMKRMMNSLYTYGGIERGSYGFNKYLSEYINILGEKLFNKTYNEELKRLQEYEVVQNVHTDSEGLTYNSLKRKLKEGGIVQDSWRKSGEGNLSIAETKKVAKKYAEGLSMSGEGIFTVNPKVQENSFDLDFNDEEYDGGSYIIYGDGSVVNMAVNPSERYGSINSTPTQIKNKFIDIQKQYKNAEFKDLIRNDGSVYGKRMVSELKYEDGGDAGMIHLISDNATPQREINIIEDDILRESKTFFNWKNVSVKRIKSLGSTDYDKFIEFLYKKGYGKDKYEEGGETFMAGGMTNEDILRSFLTSEKETQTNNLATFYSTLGAVMLLRNYGTLIAKRMGRMVEITNVKYSKTTSAITNRLKALAEEMGYNVSYVSEFEEGGITKKRRRSPSVQYGGSDRLIDKQRSAKPVGYRFTDTFAKKNVK
jgi:hypothetical protein